MFYSQESADKALIDLGYQKLERKPWNVKEGDVIVLEDSTRPRLPVIYIPVEVTLTDKYADFYRTWWTSTIKTSRTTYKFYHKPVNPSDLQYLYSWHNTAWRSLDTVELYRKTA